MAPKPPANKPPSPKNPTKQQADTEMAFQILGIFVVVVLLFFWWLTKADPVTQSVTTFFTEKSIASHVDVTTDGSGQTHMKLQQGMTQGDTILSVPIDTVVDIRGIAEGPVGALLQTDNSSVLSAVTQEHKLGQAFSNLLFYASFLAFEKRKGADAKLAQWIATIDKAPRTGPLFWSPAHDECLDPLAAKEIEVLRKTLAAAVGAMAQLCDSAVDTANVCGGNAPTEDELRWGMSVYMARSFQDQAIVPGLDLADVRNDRPGVYPQFNEEARTLEIKLPTPGGKGEEVFRNHGRGPVGYFVATGKFDDAQFMGIEARVQPTPDDLTRKVCYAKQQLLTFLKTGSPSDALFDCIGLLVADKKERKIFEKQDYSGWRSKKKLWRHAVGNVTALAVQESESLGGFEAPAHCAEQTPEKDAMRGLVAATKDIMKRNAENLKARHAKLMAKA